MTVVYSRMAAGAAFAPIIGALSLELGRAPLFQYLDSVSF